MAKNWFKNNWYILLGLTFLVFAVYANGLNAAFVSDDLPGILNNPDTGNFGHLLKLPNNPAVWFMYCLAYAIGGLNPFFYRLFNILFHTGCTVGIFILINLLANKKTAIMASAIFAVHPILIEAVTWISGGSHAGYTLFFLLALITYIVSSNQKKLYALSVVFFAVCLLFSDKAVSLFLIFPLYEISFGSLKKNLKKILPFLLLGAIAVVNLAARFVGRVSDLKTYNYVEPGLDNPLIKIPVAVTEYLRLIFWPSDLSLYRDELVFTWEGYLVRLGIFLILAAIIVISYRIKKPVFFWLTFFLISLAPTLTPFRIASTVAERYVYAGSIGIFTITGMALNYFSGKKNLKNTIYWLFAVLLIALSVRTIIRNRDWLNEDNLWIASAKVAPLNPNVLNNLGDMYGRHGDYLKAIESFSLAIKLKPGYADAYHNLANIQISLFEQTKDEKYLNGAIANYQTAAKYNPTLWQSHQNLGAIYFNLGRRDEAVNEFEKALGINPGNQNLIGILKQIRR